MHLIALLLSVLLDFASGGQKDHPDCSLSRSLFCVKLMLASSSPQQGNRLVHTTKRCEGGRSRPEIRFRLGSWTCHSRLHAQGAQVTDTQHTSSPGYLTYIGPLFQALRKP